MMQFFIRSLLVGMCLCTMSSCSYFSTPEEPIEEEPFVCTEDPLDVHLDIVDKRWCKEGGYGMPSVSIYLRKDLALMIRDPMIEGLEIMNLYESDTGVDVKIIIEQFFCDVLERKSSWNCVSEIIFVVKVVTCDGEELYSRRISGLAENDFELTERNGKSRKALESALADAVCNLLGDKAFRNSIKKAARLAAPTPVECF